MRDRVVVDELDNVIAMIAFINTSTTTCNGSDSSRTLSDREICGFQEIMFRIERDLEEISDCLCGEPTSFKELYTGMPVITDRPQAEKGGGKKERASGK